MKGTQKEARNLSHKVLFRIVLNRLWNEYSSGGISHNRSYQATLLEGFMDLFHLDDPHYQIRSDVFKEIKDRTEKYAYSKRMRDLRTADQNYTQLNLPFVELDTLNNEEFSLLSLCEMCRWYEEEAQRLGFHYQFPEKICHYLKDMCELCFSKSIRIRIDLKQVTKAAIIEQGNRRREYKSKQESRMDDFIRLGINPWNDRLRI